MSARDNDPNRDRLLDHEADGIREFDNALPRWWLYGFYLTIVFAAVYVVNYHVLAAPLFGRPGMVAEYEAEVAGCAAGHGRAGQRPRRRARRVARRAQPGAGPQHFRRPRQRVLVLSPGGSRRHRSGRT